MTAYHNHSEDYDNTYFQNHLATSQHLNDHCALQGDATAFVNISLQKGVGGCWVPVAVSSSFEDIWCIVS